jgi:transcription elongation factor Elf1
MARLMTGLGDYSVKSKRKTILDRLEDNRTVTGEILCIACEAANMVQETRPFIVSEGVGEKKTIKINTLHCNLCGYQVIDDKETKQMRKKFK